MKTLTVLLILAAALLVAGCPKRQSARRLIYTPPPAPSTSLPHQQAGVLVIQPPPPPAPVEPAPKPEESEVSPPEPKLQPQRRTNPVGASEPNGNTAEPAPAEAPQLEPARSAQQQIELERQIGALRGAVSQRIERLSHMSLSAADRKALEDAGLFLSQADQAMRGGDLQQSLNLEQKADLLISAVEKRH